MTHAYKNTHHGHHFCRCGAGWETRADCDRHIAAYNEVAAGERLKRDAAAQVKRDHPNLTAHREKRR